MRTARSFSAAFVVAVVGVIVGGGSALWLERDSQAHPVPAAVTAKLPPPSPSQRDAAEAVSRTFAQVAAQVGPSVVRIVVRSKVVRRGEEDNPFRGTPFERFFDEDDGQPRTQRRMGLGSGVVVDPRGYILTNNHVVENAVSVRVTFVDGKEVPAKVVGRDPKSDLAVVKVDGVSVKPAKLGDPNKLQVGDWVMAIGNPFGLDHTVTLGVLSAKNRSGFESGQYEDFLQTDASINPGNSGGPLVDLDGEVIGITTMIAGIGTGIGFAVPTSMARPIVDQLIQTGKVRRAWLGVVVQDVTPELEKAIGEGAPAGAIVSEVQKGSPAEKAGLKPGDVITAVDGKPVKTSRDVQADVLATKIGDRVDVALWRNGKSEHLTATTAELPASKEKEQAAGGGAPSERLGLELQTLTPELAKNLGLPSETRGAVVAGVESGSRAAEEGLKEGDVIVEVDHKAVASAEDAARALKSKRAAGHLLRVRRGEAAAFIVLPSG